MQITHHWWGTSTTTFAVDAYSFDITFNEVNVFGLRIWWKS